MVANLDACHGMDSRLTLFFVSLKRLSSIEGAVLWFASLFTSHRSPRPPQSLVSYAKLPETLSPNGICSGSRAIQAVKGGQSDGLDAWLHLAGAEGSSQVVNILFSSSLQSSENNLQ